MISDKAKELSSFSHIQRSWNVGENGQRRYYNSCRAAKLSVKRASDAQDMKHVDFLVEGKTIDVKGLKDTHKMGQILLEIKNVQGRDGWCSKSGPEWVAFDFGAFFLHVKNLDLVSLVAKKCDLNNIAKRASEALYRGYTRKDRDDLMTVVSLTDVIKMCEHWYLPAREFYEPMESM